MELSIEIIMVLFFVALLAGFVDAAAGGGGLIVVPALLLTGMPPVAALATNKLQGSAGSLSASLTMIKKGLIHPKNIKLALVMAFLGSSVGTILVQLSSPELLKMMIPIVVGLMGLYTLFAPNLGEVEQKPKISHGVFQKVVTPVIGFYDGYLGPGTGTFFSLSGVVLRGMDLVAATAQAKLLNFATNIAALIFFILGGQVVWLVGLVMIVGQVLGAFLGSNMVIKGGVKFIRPMIVVMCFAMVIRYVFW